MEQAQRYVRFCTQVYEHQRKYILCAGLGAEFLRHREERDRSANFGLGPPGAEAEHDWRREQELQGVRVEYWRDKDIDRVIGNRFAGDEEHR